MSTIIAQPTNPQSSHQIDAERKVRLWKWTVKGLIIATLAAHFAFNELLIEGPIFGLLIIVSLCAEAWVPPEFRKRKPPRFGLVASILYQTALGSALLLAMELRSGSTFSKAVWQAGGIALTMALVNLYMAREHRFDIGDKAA